jgi:gamma-glutamylcyclotransferase (GGCT)/AIG2-like uncharacterized protein YtfP
VDCAYLFVYGTLRRPFQNRFAQLLSQNATFLGHARMRGRLYRIHTYPGLKLSPDSDEWVIGEVYHLNDPASLLAILDGYEGCGPEDKAPHEFTRVLAHATLASGPDVDAWVYQYNHAAPEQLRILSGDFLHEG